MVILLIVNDFQPLFQLERPVANESEAVVLTFGLTLQQIIDVVSSHMRASHQFQQIIDICAAEHCAQFTTTSPHPKFSYSPPQEPKKTAEALY